MRREIDEKHYFWNELHQRLSVIGADEEEETKINRLRKRNKPISKSQIYCPHDYLILNFLDSLSPSEKLHYQKRYYRKVSPNEPDIVILQDIKNLVLYFCTTPLSPQFISFFHLRIVDRLLRALIIYFQFYIQIWEEEIMKKRAATAKKARNPLAGHARLKKSEELRVLRCIIAREYCLLLLGTKETARFHHMTGGIDSKSIISQGEKDFRIFESFIQAAQRIIWISLARKHYYLIEVELHRLFRTEAYSIGDRTTGYMVNQELLEDERLILHGPKMPSKGKFLINTPLVYEFLNETFDHRLLALGSINLETMDPRIIYLKNALLTDEDKLEELGIKVGILGEPRIHYDITLIHITVVKAPEEEEGDEITGAKRRSLSEKAKRSTSIERRSELPLSDPDSKPPDVLTSEKVPEISSKYDNYREDARKMWILREVNRQTQLRNLNTTKHNAISIATNTEN